MSSIGNVLKSIQKDYPGDLIKLEKKESTISRVTLTSPTMNYLFSGGVPEGRITIFAGQESGGKTTTATLVAADIQKKKSKNVILFIDMEHTFDADHSRVLGLDTDSDKFILLRPTSGEDAFDMAVELVKTGEIGLLVWDSVAVTATKGKIQDIFRSDYGGTANVMTEGLKVLNPYLSKSKTPSIFINQLRVNMSQYGSDTRYNVGGNALLFYASNIFLIRKKETIKEKGVPVAVTMVIRNVKSKTGIPFRTGEMTNNFVTGFDFDDEYVNFMKEAGIIKQGGAWYKNEDWDMNVQGLNGVRTFLSERPDLFEQAKNTVNETFLVANKIDENNFEKAKEEGLLDKEEL